MKTAVGLFVFAVCNSLTTAAQILPNGNCVDFVSGSTHMGHCAGGMHIGKQNLPGDSSQLIETLLILAPDALLVKGVPGDDEVFIGMGSGSLVNEAMTQQERNLCQRLLDGSMSKEDFLCEFPQAVSNGNLARRLLDEAILTKDARDLNCAMIIGFHFGFGKGSARVLSKLIDAEWHFSHEDVVDALDTLRVPEYAHSLFRATEWVPKYLQFDERRALAVKASWALWRLRTEESRRLLEKLSRSDDSILRDTATMLLNKKR